MALLAISCPKLKERDYERIQSLRAEHDKMHFGMLDPHFTLVFPVETIDQSDLLPHIRSIVTATKSIHFALRCAVVNHNTIHECWHVFLVPEEGYSQIVKLHDSLYTGMLTNELRLDLPYIPHITVASLKDASGCKALADDLNRENLVIEGEIEAVDVASYGAGAIERIERIWLRDRLRNSSFMMP